MRRAIILERQLYVERSTRPAADWVILCVFGFCGGMLVNWLWPSMPRLAGGIIVGIFVALGYVALRFWNAWRIRRHQRALAEAERARKGGAT